MQDEIDPAESFEDAIGEAIEELRTMGVRDNPDPRRQLPDPGRLQPGRVGAFGIGARVECVERGRGENMCSSLVQVQVNVGERIPGAIRLAARVDTLRWRGHRGGRDLRSNGNVLATRQRREGGLRRGVTCVYWRATSFRPREPFRVRAVLGRWHHPLLLGVVLVLLLDHLPRRGCGRGRSRCRGRLLRTGGHRRASRRFCDGSRWHRRLRFRGADTDLRSPRWYFDHSRPIGLGF